MAMEKKRPSPTRKHYHHGHLREDLIAASLKIIAKKGLQALSVREAAKYAGVSSAAPYRHFPTKASLLAAIATQGYAQIGQLLRETVAQAPHDLTSQLMQAAKAYVRFAMQEPEIFRVMFHLEDQDRYPELAAAHEQTEAMFLEMIRQGQDQDLIAGGDPVDYATAAIAFLNGLSSLLMDEHVCEHLCPKDQDVEAWMERLLQILWNGYHRRPLDQVPKSRNRAGHHVPPQKRRRSSRPRGLQPIATEGS